MNDARTTVSYMVAAYLAAAALYVGYVSYLRGQFRSLERRRSGRFR